MIYSSALTFIVINHGGGEFYCELCGNKYSQCGLIFGTLAVLFFHREDTATLWGELSR